MSDSKSQAAAILKNSKSSGIFPVGLNSLEPNVTTPTPVIQVSDSTKNSLNHQTLDSNNPIDSSSHRHRIPIHEVVFGQPSSGGCCERADYVELKKVHPDDIVYYSYYSYSEKSQADLEEDVRMGNISNRFYNLFGYPDLPEPKLQSTLNSRRRLSSNNGHAGRKSNFGLIEKLVGDPAHNLSRVKKSPMAKTLPTERDSLIDTPGVESIRKRGTFKTDFQKLIFGGLQQRTGEVARKDSLE